MPIPVKTRPRFKCQFCLSYRATIKAVERHEGYCWQNPDRFCAECQNEGVAFRIGLGANLGVIENEIPCPYCSKEIKDLTATLKIYNERKN